jgi:hypothetical protein
MINRTNFKQINKKKKHFNTKFYRDWLRAGRHRSRSSSPGKVKNLLHVVQTGSGAHPTSYPMGTGGFFYMR